MQQWEYYLLERSRGAGLRGIGDWDVSNLEKRLSVLGEQGWELIGISSRSGSSGAAFAGTTTEETWVFKRPKE